MVAAMTNYQKFGSLKPQNLSQGPRGSKSVCQAEIWVWAWPASWKLQGEFAPPLPASGDIP